MGDVLPPKRTVVERLRLRLERYRWHQNSCLPRYEQSANALFDRQRQDTIRLKQRFLESKAKKVKSSKSDHHRAPIAGRESTPDSAQKAVAHSKSSKVVSEGSPANPPTDPPTDELERSAKITQPENTKPESLSTSDPSLPPTPSFSLPVVQQFASCNPPTHPSSIQANSNTSESIAASQNHNHGPKQTQNMVSQSKKRTSQIESFSNIKCKQEEEKPNDICQFKTPPPSSDRLSDTFPSIGFAEDSGDNIIHPDLLKDIIDDVFTNAGDITKDFDFEDSVCSMKDGEKDDIEELVKASAPVSQVQAFHSNNVIYNSHPMSQVHPSGASLFDNSVITTSATITPVSAVTPSTTDPLVYGSHQRMPTYSTSSNLNMPNGLGLDFKLTEPSPAALTLKQMAEQHQNMQQKQQQLGANLNTSFSSLRNQFSMESFSNPMPNFNSRFLNGHTQRSQSLSMYLPYDSNYPGVVPITDNNLFKQESFSVGSNSPMINAENQKHLLQMACSSSEKKHQSCSGDRSSFYQDSVMQPNLNQRVVTNQYVGSMVPEVGMHVDQTQQISPVHNGRSARAVPQDMKQADVNQQSFSNMYSYNTQPANEHIFHLSMNQNNASYNSSYNIQPNNHHPPPEYKMLQANIRPNNVTLGQNTIQPSPSYHHQLMAHQKSSNVAPNQWRNIHQTNHLPSEMFQNQEAYGNLDCTGTIPSSIHHSPMHHPYRTVNIGQISPNPVPSAIVSSSQPLQQQVSLHHQQQHLINSGLPNINMNLGSVSTSQLYNGQQDLNTRQDNNQISLDFLDHIESSAPDLLNFDNVIQNSDTTHFQLLDDMEILGK